MVSVPHGGKLVNRVLDPEKRREFLENAAGEIQIDRATALDIEKIAFGAYSPLEGFLGSEDYSSVIRKGELSNGLAWTIPIIFAPPDPSAENFSEGDEIALMHQGKAIAILELEQKYLFSKKELAEKVYGTTDPAHPDVERIGRMGNMALAGSIWLLERISPQEELIPIQTRRIFQERGWKTIAGFQTRNPPHNAHEYLQRCALEIVDGLFIHPVVGELKHGDFPPEAIIESYAYLISNYYPPERVVLSPLSILMRYAGPKAAVFLAIIRKNYGCTHFIVGRDMAGVGNYYEPYAAHKLLEEIDLGIQPILFLESHYCRRCRSMATNKTCGHSLEDKLKISMTHIRKLIAEGRRPPAEIMRPEIADLLMKYRSALA